MQENINFTKKDLKTGMWIENREGSFGMVLLDTENGDIISGQTWCPLKNINENLLHVGNDTDFRGSDIVKVYQPTTNCDYLDFIRTKEVNIEDWKLLWERKKVEAESLVVTELKQAISDIERELQTVKETLESIGGVKNMNVATTGGLPRRSPRF